MRVPAVARSLSSSGVLLGVRKATAAGEPAAVVVASCREACRYPFIILRMPSANSLMPSSGVIAFVVTFPKTGWITFADICP